MKSTLKERLYAKLPERPEDGCWEFTGGLMGSGYGNLYTHSVGRRSVGTGAHRASWMIHRGPIPKGKHVLHECDNKLCCNPAHLFLGTHADNMRDKAKKGRALPGPVADPEWWTEERRDAAGQRSTERWKRQRRRRQKFAGVSSDTKFCPTCRRWLALDQFGNNRARHDGKQAHCKPCKNEANIVRVRRKRGLTDTPRRATRSDKKHFLNQVAS